MRKNRTSSGLRAASLGHVTGRSMLPVRKAVRVPWADATDTVANPYHREMMRQMPTLKRLCEKPGCGETTERGAYCDEHKRKKRRSTKQYDRAWRRARAAYLDAHPACEQRGCVEPSEQVDHIVPMSRGGSKLDWSNLQALCHSCHSRKTANEFRGMGGRFGS